MAGNYDDIINMEHPTSKKHKRMSMYARAAQFAPFAALTGHDAAVKEKARLTTEKIELDEGTKEILNEKLQIILDRNEDELPATVLYFVPDERKTGGSYVTKTGVIKMYDEYEGKIIFSDKSSILIDYILQIESEILKSYEMIW